MRTQIPFNEGGFLIRPTSMKAVVLNCAEAGLVEMAYIGMSNSTIRWRAENDKKRKE